MERSHSVLIDPFARVDDNCKIGTGTRIWQFASVIRGSKIGKDCTLGSCALLDGAHVGDECAIGAGAQLHPGTKLGNSVFFGPGALALNDVWPKVGKDGWRYPEPGEWFVVVEDGAAIGAGAIILPGVRIGKGALVAAGARVKRSVPPGAVYQRNDYTAPQRPANWQQRRMRFVQC